MIVERQPGATLVDTAALAALTARPVAAVRRWCQHAQPDRYDLDAATVALAGRPDPIVVTATDAHRYLGIPAGTIYSWVSRGQLAPLDRDGHGRPRYDTAELARLQGAPA